MDKKTWQWQRTIASQTFTISTDRSFLPIPFVQEAFATDAMYWAQPLSASATKTMLSSSLTLGIYETSSSNSNDDKTPVGMARLVTDYTTLAYLTDVYLLDSCRNMGLGKWIIACCRDIVLEMPDLRFIVLLTGSEQAQKLYRRELGMSCLDGRELKLTCMGARKEEIAEASKVVGRASGGERVGDAATGQ